MDTISDLSSQNICSQPCLKGVVLKTFGFWTKAYHFHFIVKSSPREKTVKNIVIKI